MPRAAVAAPAEGTVVVRHYLDAVQAKRYADAFALLDAGERAYFGSVANYASSFIADGYALEAYRVRSTHAAGHTIAVLVDERIALDDPAHDVRVRTDVTLPYDVSGSGDAARVADRGRPRWAFASVASATGGDVRVIVKRLASYDRMIRVVVTLQNVGARFVTVLPYGRSVLRAGNNVYRPIESRDWTVTDRQFFLGLRLAPNSRITGAMAFAVPAPGERVRPFDLHVAPVLGDGGSAPYAIDVVGIGPRG